MAVAEEVGPRSPPLDHAAIRAIVVGAIVVVLLWIVLPRLQEAKDGDDAEVVEAEARDEQEGVGTQP